MASQPKGAVRSRARPGKLTLGSGGKKEEFTAGPPSSYLSLGNQLSR